MKVTVGKLAGFCGGVTNSVNKTYKLLEQYSELYCLGELVHNQQVVDELKDKGLIFIEELDEAPVGSKVIIRAHGVNRETYDKAKELKQELFDLTCPKVLAIHDLASELENDDNFIVLVAQKNHPEAIGTISFCGNDSMIVEKVEDIELLEKQFNDSAKNKIAIISQTTFSVKKFDDICELIKSKFDIVDVHNTICLATSKRQEETDELSKKVDAMIIIGGANSSNTKKLYELSKNNNENTFIVQTAQELNENDFSKYKHIGVMAGASTPRKSIEEVIKYLEEIK
jgi:4-hydroxy-3-methylbut-2-enyl diphosphate reductase